MCHQRPTSIGRKRQISGRHFRQLTIPYTLLGTAERLPLERVKNSILDNCAASQIEKE